MEIRFDRGSIVVEGEGLPEGMPGGAIWDARVGLWRAEAYRLPEIVRWLDRRASPFSYRSPRPDGFFPLRMDSSSLPDLRPYQAEALAAWNGASRRGIVCLPTGSGKTRLAVRAVLTLGAPALVVAPTRELIHQWVDCLRRAYPGPIGCYGDGERDLHPITVATYESAYLHLDRLGSHFDLLVADEVHHLASDRWAEIARMATAAARLGLTATPPPAGPGVELLDRLLGPVCFALPIESLSGTYLSPVEVRVISLRLDPEEQREYDGLRAIFREESHAFFATYRGASWADFARAAGRTEAGRGALRAFHKARKILGLPRSKRSAIDHLLDLHASEATLLFTADTADAYEISRRFLIPAITCETERSERKEILRRFEDGIYRALVSAKVLNEGVDVPSASVAVVVGGSGSPVEHAQRIGRVLRPMPGKKARVYELVLAGTGERWASMRRNHRSVLERIPALPP